MFPCSLILWPKPCFCYLMRKFAFSWGKNIIHKQQCTRMCRGVACKPRRQESVISKASLHADHPPMCLNCCVSAQWFNTAMLPSVKRWGIISATILFYLLWIQLELSLIFHFESAQRRGSHDLLCFYINTLRPSDKFMHRWFMSSLVKTIVCNICGAKPLSKPLESRCWTGVSYPLLSSPRGLFNVCTILSV